jgi:pimeloyl-ACP methyl ester carboxylesterase
MFRARVRVLIMMASALATIAGGAALGDLVVMKNGMIYRGEVDKDVPLVHIYDGLKRVLVRESKVQKIDTADAPEKLEQFLPQQPLDVHAGQMPQTAIILSATPWDESGRRTFKYIGPRSKKPITMTQGIIALNPQTVRFRGIDNFWQGQLATSQVPKASILAMLGKVDQTNEDWRLRVVRFLIQAHWFPEAKAELDRLGKDFPALKDKVQAVRQTVMEIEAQTLLHEVDVRRKAQQYRDVVVRLKTLPVEGAPGALQVAVRDALRGEETQAALDKALADSIQKCADALTPAARATWKNRLVEVLQGLHDAPDAFRDHLSGFEKAKDDAAVGNDAKFALAMSGWVVGSDMASDDLDSADSLWAARASVRTCLVSNDELDRGALLSLENTQILDPKTKGKRSLDVATVARIAQLSPPPLADISVKAGEPKLLRVKDDPNPDQPTEYSVLLPPEYNPARSYPAIVALHWSGAATPKERTESAIKWWSSEATRRGYIVIAPEFTLRGQALDYRYSPSEHAAAELTIRDALRRFAIDSDRVFLAGSLLGGHMAWDFGLGHPDMFAGVVVISGVPAKYVWPYKDNTRRVPFYVIMGDLGEGEAKIRFEFCKSMIVDNYDVTATEYYQRGVENFPEEIPTIFDWMDRHTREPYPRTFEVKTGRTCDNRFYGVVVREFARNRSLPPEAIDGLGKNLKPASISGKINTTLNRLDITTYGVPKVDIWVPLAGLDFTKKLQVRLDTGSRTQMLHKEIPKRDFEPMLQDLRVRGDRKQLFGLKVSN